MCVSNILCATRSRGGVNEYFNIEQNNQLLDKWKGSPQEKKATEKESFNIAIITAGHIRSFFYVKQSWERYLFSKLPKDNMYLFSHVVASPVSRECPIISKGIHAIIEMSTECEVSYSDAPFPTPEVFPNVCCNSSRLHTMSSGGISTGAVLDMHARRHRAYTLAKQYAFRRKISWDLVLFIRPDAAFYGTYIDYRQLHLLLTAYHADTGRDGILIPGDCNFRWLCDRMAIGFPHVMDAYFNVSAVTAELWYAQHRDFTGNGPAPCMSEQVLAIWMYMHNISHLELAGYTGFATLRIECASIYCRSSRKGFLHGNCIPWMDATLVVLSKLAALPESEDDLIRDTEFRCGKDELYSADIQGQVLSGVCLVPEKKWRAGDIARQRSSPTEPTANYTKHRHQSHGY
jgi:hypothetical protein